MPILIICLVVVIWYMLASYTADTKKRHKHYRVIALTGAVSLVLSFWLLLYQISLTTPVDSIP
jgi:hypothetical protein